MQCRSSLGSGKNCNHRLHTFCVLLFKPLDQYSFAAILTSLRDTFSFHREGNRGLQRLQAELRTDADTHGGGIQVPLTEGKRETPHERRIQEHSSLEGPRPSRAHMVRVI